MMYKNKLAAAIKCNGNVLREHDETVYLPFGSEYSIYFKNLETVRANVSINIDGKDIGNGRTFVIDPNSECEIERFLTSNNLNKGNRFKFIERTTDVEHYRGAGIADGLIRIEYQFERVNYDTAPTYIYYNPIMTKPFWDNNNTIKSCNSNTFTSPDSNIQHSTNRSIGITAAGSISNQQFTSISGFPLLPDKHVIVFNLLGETENKAISEPITVKHKIKCSSCGKNNKSSAKFCSNCGTSLEIV